MAPTTTPKQVGVLVELDAQQGKLARVRRHQTVLSDELRAIGSRKPPSGKIAAALDKRLAELAQAIADDRPAATAAIDKEIAALEDHRNDVVGEIAACNVVIQQLADERRSTLLTRHEELMQLAREKAAEGDALIATARAAAADVELHRGQVTAAVQLAVTGVSDDIVKRRAAAATFSPWLVPRDGDGRTPTSNRLPAYWSALELVARGVQ
jgi:chromosome segregation ATPase